MKLEPVGYYNPEIMDEVVSGNREGGVILWARQSEDNDRVPAYTIPNGYVVVPVEPTAAMNFAAYDECQRVSTVQIGLATAAKIYKAMIAAKEQS